MNRTFHHKISPQSVVGVALYAAAAMWFVYDPTFALPVAGFLCLFLGAASVDRMVRTTYTFTDDGRLRIVRGRTGGRLEIGVDEIVAVRRVRGNVASPPHIVIEYGTSGSMTSVQPSDFDAFEAEIGRRQRAMETRGGEGKGEEEGEGEE